MHCKDTISPLTKQYITRYSDSSKYRRTKRTCLRDFIILFKLRQRERSLCPYSRRDHKDNVVVKEGGESREKYGVLVITVRTVLMI